MNEKKLYQVLFALTREDSRLPALAGILHADGFMLASDANTLARVHYEDYDFDYEGVVIGQTMQAIDFKYPGTGHLITSEHLTELSEDLVSNILAGCNNLPKKSNKPGEFVCLDVEGFYLDVFEVVGETPAIFIGGNPKHMLLKSANCIALLMPEVWQFGAKDLLFTIAEALEFKN